MKILSVLALLFAVSSVDALYNSTTSATSGSQNPPIPKCFPDCHG
ncbi:MAG TPA: hypothetical protein VMB71_12800 [Acetobacteraceae bacterium]|nr:hypothetical protein [Acetobacteraceae bacterium]